MYRFILLFARISGWVGGVWEILTFLGFEKPYGILDDHLDKSKPLVGLVVCYCVMHIENTVKCVAATD